MDYQTGYETGASAGMSAGLGIFYLVITVVLLVALWKLFEKAGQAGWKSIIPFYNAYVLLKIAGKPGWWLVLYLIPLVNIVIQIIVGMALGKKFGKDDVYGFFLLGLLPAIGYLHLGFGKATYKASVK